MSIYCEILDLFGASAWLPGCASESEDSRAPREDEGDTDVHGSHDGDGGVAEEDAAGAAGGVQGYVPPPARTPVPWHRGEISSVESRIEPTRYPHWCRDLGVRWCMTDAYAPEGTERFLRSLADTQPEDFLPAGLARFVRLCETARLNHDTVMEAGCRILAPFRGELTSVVVIPRDTLAQAQLPGSGARVVVDCRGRHLQIRGDLSPADNLGRLRRAFADLYSISLSDFLAPYASSDAGHTSMETCAVGAARRGDGARARSVRWRAPVLRGFWFLRQRTDGGDSRGEAAPLPQAYVTQSCFAPGMAHGEPPPRPSGVEGLFSLEAEIRRLEASDEHSIAMEEYLDSLLAEVRDRISADPELLRELIPEQVAREEEYESRCGPAAMQSLLDTEYEEREEWCASLGSSFDISDEARDVLTDQAMAFARWYYNDLDCENPEVANPRCTELGQGLSRLEAVISDYSCSFLYAGPDCSFDAQATLEARESRTDELPTFRLFSATKLVIDTPFP